MSLDLEDLVSEVKAIYKPLRGKTFKGCIDERETTAVYTGGPRDIVIVEDDAVSKIMQQIVTQIEKISLKFQPETREEKVWKGITVDRRGSRLWVESYDGDDDTISFTVKKIEVVTELKWKKSYKAMVNITLE